MRASVVVIPLLLVAPVAAQAPRNSHVVVSTPDGVLLFGGGDGRPRLVDTLWVWRGTTWEPLATGGPHARNLPGAAYDSRRRVLVLYGGNGPGSGTLFGDTWEWSGGRWDERNVRTPGPRDHHAMAFDAATGVTLVQGGSVRGTLAGDTWTWDGTVWTRLDSATSGPGPRAHHAMAYDEHRRRVVLFGGIGPDGRKLGDVWEWDGSGWERVTAGGGPGPRSHHRMAYDPDRREIVLFGGGDGAARATWTFDGAAWTEHDVPGPAPRWSSAMAWDPSRRRVVLFGGGRNARPFDPLGDTWEWDGATWRPASSSDGGNPGQSQAILERQKPRV